MRLDDIVDELQRTDLTPDECRVYVALVRGGPRRASEVADAADLHRTKVYRILDALQERDLVQASVGRPTEYEARPPADLFEAFEQDIEDELAGLRDLRETVLPTLQELAHDDPGKAAGPHWKVVEGRARILEELARMVREADTSIDAMSNHDLTTHLVPTVREVWENALERAREGTRLRGLLAPTDGSWDQVMDWANHPGVEMRHLDTDRPVHVALVDGDEVLVWVTMDPSPHLESEGDVAVWTDAPALVSTLQLTFEATWDRSDPIVEHRPDPRDEEDPEDADGPTEAPSPSS